MSDNGNNEQFVLLPWLKGHPRTVSQASSCTRLTVGCLVQERIMPLPPSERPQLVGSEPRPTFATVGMTIQPLSLVCNSPAVIAMAKAGMKPHVAQACVAISLPGYDLCQICPYFEAPPKV